MQVQRQLNNNCYTVCRCIEWLKRSGRTDLMDKDVQYISDNCRLCSDHFEDAQLQLQVKKLLLPHSLPTIFDDCDVSSKTYLKCYNACFSLFLRCKILANFKEINIFKVSPTNNTLSLFFWIAV